MLKPDYERDGVKLYRGDCLEILPQIERVDAVVTDPPYGIGADRGQSRRANHQHGRALAPSKDYGESDWDAEPCSPLAIELIRSASTFQIIFGGNFFELPPSRCWLVWDKMNGNNDFADCELAWTNLKKAVRRLRLLWNGCMRVEKDIQRTHPTQKPVGVMSWCLKHLPDAAQTILDPFMGSGTTGVACIRTGRKFIGIEIEQKYFDIAVRRIEQAFEDTAMFREVEKEKQLELLP